MKAAPKMTMPCLFPQCRAFCLECFLTIFTQMAEKKENRKKKMKMTWKKKREKKKRKNSKNKNKPEEQTVKEEDGKRQTTAADPAGCLQELHCCTQRH